MSNLPLNFPLDYPQRRHLVTAVPGPKSEEMHRRRQAAVSAGVYTALPVYARAGRGGILIDVDGNSLVDMTSGVSVTAMGHCDAEVIAAIQKQANLLHHTLFAITPYEPYIRLAEMLAELTPGDFPKRSVLLNAGAEAIENAVKIARSYTGRPGVAVLDYSFHGRTNLTIGLSYRGSFYARKQGPQASDIYSAPNSYPLHDGLSGEEAAARTISVLETRIHPEDLACLILEPIQGEGGFIVPADGYLPRLAEWCREHGIVFVADEIQCGYGHTGRMFASEWEGIVPDLVCTAKSIANGLPVSAVTGRAEIMDAAAVGSLGGTYGGNPVACAAAIAVLEQFEEKKVLKEATRVGKTLRKRLEKLAEKYPEIAEVRGRGAMQAIELLDPSTKAPLGPEVGRILKAAAGRGVLFMGTGINGNIIRFLPNLLMSDELIEDAVNMLDEALAEVIGADSSR